MKFKLSLLFVLVSVCSLLMSTTWHIKQDGTGNFTIIQDGIDTSADSDTVLVYPGTYFENIDFIGKNITVTSRYIENQNETYIHNTIIDGNQNGSCVKIVNEEDENAMLCGFTIQNGSGSQMLVGHDFAGGGIYCFNSTPIINSCIIKNNRADNAAGIYAESYVEDGYCCPYLTNCTIKYNQAYNYYGGLGCLFNSNMEFDPDDRCNIYCNYAARRNDLGSSRIQNEPMIAYIDTFTVLEPDNFFFNSFYGNDELHINYAKIEPVDADLYVAPDGDNSNSGLTPDDPLQNIAFALIKIAPDSLDSDPNSIYVAAGDYSPSLTDEKFPFNCRSYVSFIGENRENTTLDLEGHQHMFDANDYERDYSIKNFTLTNSNDELSRAAIWIVQPRNVTLENLRICNYLKRDFTSIVTPTHSTTILDSTSFYLSDVEIIDNIGAKACSISGIEECIVSNMYVNNNTPLYGAEDPGGGGIGFGGRYNDPNYPNCLLINSEITQNVNGDTDWSNASSAILISDHTIVNIVNCTIGNNEAVASLSAAILIGDDDAECNIINSVIYGNIPRQILLDLIEYPDDPCVLNIRNSLVQGGETEIYDEGGNIINWLEGNLPADADPLWQMNGDYPFMLSENSPCIDAGTLDLPPGIELPEFDLAGNPRIYGETIDMGAYEFQGDPQSNDENEIIIPEITEISNYPNPFNPSTTIKLDLAESGKIELAIYNIKGQKVKTLMDAYSTKGHFEIIWQGTDDNKRSVGSGQYFIKLKVNGNEEAVSKCILLK